jgi:acyl-[acyl-carrier-protein]-phospholipid O-acyltransferase/long-chain-fatty-acid--[acyl-carrier-protein] ligase
MAERFYDFVVRAAFWLVARAFFRIRVAGRENIPQRGPALVVPNHVTFVDSFIVGFSVPPVVRFLVWKPYYELKSIHWALRVARAIPVGTDPHELTGSIRRARRELKQGHVVCIFAEGFVTRTGELLPFQRGLETIARGLEVPIIPVQLDGLWGSMFSCAGSKVRRKWTERVRCPVTVTFGPAMPATSTADEVRQAIEQMGAGRAAETTKV